MLSIGIVWNSAYRFSNTIIEDIRHRLEVISFLDFDLGDDYIEFVKEIYFSEQMEEWKIEKKIKHMMSTLGTNIVILFLDFNESEISYHPQKKKNVYTQLEDCKYCIRKKYEAQVEDYTFDIILHATDNLEELKNCFDIIKKYLLRHKKYTPEIQKLIHSTIGEKNE